MSLQFSDTANFRGIVQTYEREIGARPGDVSGSTSLLKSFTADCNLALDDFIALAIRSSGTWQFDDSNHTDYPIMTTNLVSGQRDYSFVSDGSGNLILDIYKVFVADSAGVFSEIYPIDVQTADSTTQDSSSLTDGQNRTGTPVRYDKTANGFFLDPIANYSYSNGLKVYINREGSYFTSSDTTKKPGVPGIFHRYFAIKPALDYARRNSLSNLSSLQQEVWNYEGNERQGLVGSIQKYFSVRPRDERPRLTIKNESNK